MSLFRLIGGVLVDRLPRRSVMLASEYSAARSFFASAACLLAIREPPGVRPDDHQPAGILHDLRQGFGTVFALPWLWITITVAAIGNVTHGGPLAVALPFLVEQRFAGNVGTYGLLQSKVGLGAVLAAIWMG